MGAVTLVRTKVRAMYFNDAESPCVAKGWLDFGKQFNCTDINVLDAAPFGCQHMDIVSGMASILPICRSNRSVQAICKAKAREEIASAGFGQVQSMISV